MNLPTDNLPTDPHGEHPRPDLHDESGEAWSLGLRARLRGLRDERAPAHDLWPGIAAQVAHAENSRRHVGARRPGTGQAEVASRRHRLLRWPLPVALAATLLLAIGVTASWRDAPAPVRGTVVQREAEDVALQYRAAIAQVGVAPSTPAMQATFDDLDRNTALILDALARDPDSRLLLEQLRRTYAHRLALTQRAALT